MTIYKSAHPHARKSAISLRSVTSSYTTLLITFVFLDRRRNMHLSYSWSLTIVMYLINKLQCRPTCLGLVGLFSGQRRFGYMYVCFIHMEVWVCVIYNESLCSVLSWNVCLKVIEGPFRIRTTFSNFCQIEHCPNNSKSGMQVCLHMMNILLYFNLLVFTSNSRNNIFFNIFIDDLQSLHVHD